MSKENNTPINTDENGRDTKGRFKEGNNGKPKGATNKTTREVKEFITGFLNDKAYEISHIWNSLEDKDKANLYLHLCRLVLPKANDKELKDDTTHKPTPIHFVTHKEVLQKVKELDDEY